MLDLRTSILAFAALAALASACTKTESTSSSGTAPSASTATPTTASAPPVASTAPSAAPTTETMPSATASVAATTTASTKPGPATSGSAAAEAACGTKPQPDCPLQAWMKANANPPMLANDLPGLATALDKIVGLAPPGYTNWASIAKDGAKAAKDGDMTATKASCRTCHDQYKDKYKKEMRARKI